MSLKCPVCAAEDRADSEYESARSDNKADGAIQAHPQGGVLFSSPLRRGSSAYHPCQVRHRRRLMGTTSLTSLTLITVLANLLPNALQIVFSIILIATSKKITQFLFRDEAGQNP